MIDISSLVRFHTLVWRPWQSSCNAWYPVLPECAVFPCGIRGDLISYLCSAHAETENSCHYGRLQFAPVFRGNHHRCMNRQPVLLNFCRILPRLKWRLAGCRFHSYSLNLSAMLAAEMRTWSEMEILLADCDANGSVPETSNLLKTRDEPSFELPTFIESILLTNTCCLGG